MNRFIKTFSFNFLIFFLFIFIYPKQALAGLFINEFVSDTAGTTSDPDWVEIYNSGPDSVDLSLYKLEDAVPNTKTLSSTIQNGGFATFDWSNRLNKTGDVIKLILISDGSTINQVGYGDSGSDITAPGTGQSAGRTQDGDSSWSIFSTPTKGSTNNTSTPSPSPTPTPTLTPTASASPTASPTPTTTTSSSSTKTSTPKPTATSSPTKSPAPTATPKLATTTPTNQTSQGQEEILGVQSSPTPEISPSPSPASWTTKFAGWVSKIPILPVIFIVGGFGLIAATLVNFVRGKNVGYNMKNGSNNKEQ